MKLTDLYRLEIGTRVRLKGTNATFAVRKVDHIDNERPVFLRLINSDKPVLTKLYVGGEHTVVLENDMVDSLKLQVYGYLSDAGFMVRELFMGDSFEIKW